MALPMGIAARYSLEKGPHEKNNTPRIISFPAIKKEVANTLGSFLESSKVYMPAFIKRIDALYDTINTKNEAQLVEDAHVLHKDINALITTMNEYSKKEEAANKVDALICWDVSHSLKGSIQFLAVFEMFAHDIKNPEVAEDVRTKSLQYVEFAFVKLQEELHSFNTMDMTINGKTHVDDILSSIYDRFNGFPIEIDEAALKGCFVLCNPIIFTNIMKELKENYRKYGTDGRITVAVEKKEFVVTLFNNKKEKEAYDFSSNSGTQILQKYATELGGSLIFDYKGEQCTTILHLPIVKE